MIFERFAELICDYNFSKTAIEKVKEFSEQDKSYTFYHKVIKEWAPEQIKKIEMIKSALKEEGQVENLKIIE